VAKKALFEQKITCPVCENGFTITRVRSSACFVLRRESDFRVKYRDLDPLLYSIWVCPNCQYANMENEFVKGLSENDKKKLKTELPPLKSSEPDLWHERTPETALRAVHLALRSAIIRQAPAIVMAGLFLRGSWIFREIGNTEMEKEFLGKAKRLYEYSFEKESNRYLEQMGQARVMYLIGELNRKLGNFDDAVRWFSRILSNRNMVVEPDLQRLIRDQWEVAREEHKKGSAGEPQEEKKEMKPVEISIVLGHEQAEWLKHVVQRSFEYHGARIEDAEIIKVIIELLAEKYPDLALKSVEELKNLLAV